MEELVGVEGVCDTSAALGAGLHCRAGVQGESAAHEGAQGTGDRK